MTATLAIITPILSPFDYSALDNEVAANLRQQADQIRTRIGKATQDLIHIGRELQSAKQRLSHGQFITWVEAEIGIAARSAQAYMAMATLADDKGATIALLPPTTVHRLAAKSAPPKVVNEVVARLLAGDVPSDRAVSVMISDAKLNARQDKAQEKQAQRRSKLSKKTREAREQQRLEAELNRQRQKAKTLAAADTLIRALGINAVVLFVNAFAAEEWPHNLLSALRDQIGDDNHSRAEVSLPDDKRVQA